MKNFRIIPFLLLDFALSTVWLLYDYRGAAHPAKEVAGLPALWICPLLILLAGWGIGALTRLFKQPRPYSFYTGHIAALLAALVLFLINVSSDRQFERMYGNIESNQANRTNTPYPEDTACQARAFDLLDKRFADRNSYRITDLFSENIYDTIHSVHTKIHVSWFEYYLVSNPDYCLCARLETYNDTTVIVYVNSNCTKPDFSIRKAKKDSLANIFNKLEQ